MHDFGRWLTENFWRRKARTITVPDMAIAVANTTVVVFEFNIDEAILITRIRTKKKRNEETAN